MLKQEDCLSPGVQCQPEQLSKTLSQNQTKPKQGAKDVSSVADQLVNLYKSLGVGPRAEKNNPIRNLPNCTF